MTDINDLRAYLARLAQEFDQNLRTDVSDATQKGWGQFIAAEHHSNQIGLYGTSSGILVKTIANPSSPIDEGIVHYLIRLWSERADRTQKYFGQTVRLAFFVLALAKVTDNKLVELRDAAVKELVCRQHSDGAWGDWRQDAGSAHAPPRAETTAWALLALARIEDEALKSSLQKGAHFLQQQARGFARIETAVDPLLIGTILHILPTKEIHHHIYAAAAALLTQTAPTTDLNIYFFDYLLTSGTNQRVRRDYLCVPGFLNYCILVSAPALAEDRLSIRTLRTALAHWRALSYLEPILTTAPFQTPRSRYPATVDQAFLALSVEFVVQRTPRFGRLFRLFTPIYQILSRNFVFRVIIPFLLLIAFGTVSQEPRNIAGLVAWARGTKSEALTGFAEHNASVLQMLAIALGIIFGQSLLKSIKDYVRDKWFM